MSEGSSIEKKRPGGAYVLFATALAFLVCLVLQFSAAGKLLGPNPNLLLIEKGAEGWPEGLLRDHVVAGIELLIVVLLAFLFRWKYAWSLVAIFFAGLLGYSGYALVTGLDCGCFGNLWTPPKGFTVGLNGVFILGSFALLLMARTNKVVLGLTALLCVGGAGFGYYQAGVDRPDPKSIVAKEGNPLSGGASTAVEPDEPVTDTSGGAVASRPKSILAIPELVSIMSAPKGQQLGYVFLHEEGCSTCEQFKPLIELERDDFAQQGQPIEVVMLEINELEETYGINKYIWFTTPTLIAIDGGEIVYYDRGEDIKLPSELMDLWLTGEDLGGRDQAEDFGG